MVKISHFTGVYWHKRKQRWMARILINHKIVSRYRPTELEAALAWDDLARESGRSRLRRNFPNAGEVGYFPYIKDNIVHIPLTRGKEAICDIEDFNEIKNRIWCFNGRGYAVTSVRKKIIVFHRFLHPEWKECDHIDGDPLNNRRNNIRNCTHQQNSGNQRKHSKNNRGQVPTSQYKGVYWDTSKCKWIAKIRVEGRRISLKPTGPTELDAARAYNEAAIHYFGEFARLNIIVKPLTGVI